MLSTGGMLELRAASTRATAGRRSSPPRPGMLHPLRMAAPDVDFVAANERATCRYMKMITLPKLRDAPARRRRRGQGARGDRRARPRADRAHGRDRLAGLGCARTRSPARRWTAPGRTGATRRGWPRGCADPSTRAVVASESGVLVDGERPRRGAVDELPATAPSSSCSASRRRARAVRRRPRGRRRGGRARPAARVAGLRDLAPALGQADGGLLAHAVGLLNWHRRHRFCANCGAPTDAARGRARAPLPALRRRAPPAHRPGGDHARHRRRPRAARPPGARGRAGRFSALAGFVEPGESLEEAVAREVREESGVARRRTCATARRSRGRSRARSCSASPRAGPAASPRSATASSRTCASSTGQSSRRGRAAAAAAGHRPAAHRRLAGNDVVLTGVLLANALREIGRMLSAIAASATSDLPAPDISLVDLALIREWVTLARGAVVVDGRRARAELDAARRFRRDPRRPSARRRRGPGPRADGAARTLRLKKAARPACS